MVSISFLPPAATLPENSPPAKTGYPIPPAPQAISSSGRWLAPTEELNIHGVLIRGGMLYVGKQLANPVGITEPALINPKHPVARIGDFTVSTMGYWPSYSDISPSERRAYLNWLADGRKHPAADIGYVFLYFYGLERRALLDATTDPAALLDRPTILGELMRLAAIYSHRSNSFKQYCEQLIQFLSLGQGTDRLFEKPVPALQKSYELPFYLRLAIGQAVVASVPIPAHLASAWALHDPAIILRTAALRCHPEFLALFPIKYQQLYGDGLKIAPNRTKLKFAYHPASASLAVRGWISLNCGELPDVTALSAPIKKLQAVVDVITTELDSYSRFVGKYPERRNSADAWLQLPAQLWPPAAQQTLASIAKQAAAEMSTAQMIDLLGLFEVAASTDSLRALSKALAVAGVAAEPDILASKKSLKPGTKVVLFKDLDFTKTALGATHTSASYQIALTTIELAAAVAHADGDFSDSEAHAIHKHIASWPHLTPAQQQRLTARVHWLMVEPVSLSTIKKKIEPLDRQTRQAIAAFITLMAQADGSVTADEIKLLEKIYKLLGIDQQDLYRSIHVGSSADSGSAIGSAIGSAAARPPTGGDNKLSLDANKIAMLQRDSEQLQALFSTIFTNEQQADLSTAQEQPEAPEEPASIEPEPVGKQLLGLDPATAAFARILMSRPSWTRAELEDVAEDLEVMLDGALEQINEATLDAFDLVCAEGDEIIDINSEIVGKLSA